MSFLSDIVDWVEDEIVEPTAHFLRNVVEHPVVPLMIIGGIAVSVLAPEFLPAMLPAVEATEAIFAAEAATEAVTSATAADIGIGASELAAESEYSLLQNSMGSTSSNMYESLMANEDAATLASEVDEVMQEEAINLGEFQRTSNLPSRFNKMEQLVNRSARAAYNYESFKNSQQRYDDSYVSKRQRLEEPNKPKDDAETTPPEDGKSPAPTNPPDSKTPADNSWNDPGSTNRQGALHDLGLWRANASQTNFSTTAIVPRDLDDDPKMSQSGDFLRMKQAVYRNTR